MSKLMKKILFIILILSLFLLSACIGHPPVSKAKYQINIANALPYFSNNYEIKGNFVILHGYYTIDNSKRETNEKFGYKFYPEDLVLGNVQSIICRIDEDK